MASRYCVVADLPKQEAEHDEADICIEYICEKLKFLKPLAYLSQPDVSVAYFIATDKWHFDKMSLSGKGTLDCVQAALRVVKVALNPQGKESLLKERNALKLQRCEYLSVPTVYDFKDDIRHGCLVLSYDGCSLDDFMEPAKQGKLLKPWSWMTFRFFLLKNLMEDLSILVEDPNGDKEPAHGPGVAQVKISFDKIAFRRRKGFQVDWDSENEEDSSMGSGDTWLTSKRPLNLAQLGFETYFTELQGLPTRVETARRERLRIAGYNQTWHQMGQLMQSLEDQGPTNEGSDGQHYYHEKKADLTWGGATADKENAAALAIKEMRRLDRLEIDEDQYKAFNEEMTRYRELLEQLEDHTIGTFMETWRLAEGIPDADKETYAREMWEGLRAFDGKQLAESIEVDE